MIGREDSAELIKLGAKIIEVCRSGVESRLAELKASQAHTDTVLMVMAVIIKFTLCSQPLRVAGHKRVKYQHEIASSAFVARNEYN